MAETEDIFINWIYIDHLSLSLQYIDFQIATPVHIQSSMKIGRHLAYAARNTWHMQWIHVHRRYLEVSVHLIVCTIVYELACQLRSSSVL